MKIDIRYHNIKYCTVEIEVNGVKIDMGILDEKEREELAEVFKIAFNELKPVK